MQFELIVFRCILLLRLLFKQKVKGFARFATAPDVVLLTVLPKCFIGIVV
jgi:hypothetical protein